jgi:agmatinase
MSQAPIPRFGEPDWEFPGLDECEIVLLPIPFDETSSWGKGADRGPRAILEASPYLEFYDIETGTEVYRRGIFTHEPLETRGTAAMVEEAERVAGGLMDSGKFVVTLGGEHSVTVGPVRAAAKRFPNLTVLQLDAHGDRRDTYEGDRYNHACVMARVKETAPRVVSAGIRSVEAGEMASLREDVVFYAADIAGRFDWIPSLVESLDDPVYVTIDLDVFDPAYVPSTGTPEPGGLNWYEVTRLLRAVAERRRVVAFDVVELAPTENKASDFLAAKLVYTFLSYIFARR